jgi:GNAT superfamily N-acetyltransferase
MTNAVRVRIAEPADAEKIASVINRAFRPAEEAFVDTDRVDLEKVVDLFRTGKFLLADDEDAPIGCVYVEPRGERAYLGLLAVDPSRQRAGLGSLLMASGESYCRDLACRFMDIKIVNVRKDLAGFYHRRGYVEIGTSPFPADVATEMPCYFIDMSKPLGGD